MNPARRGWEGQLTAYVTALGVTAITGKPYKPTTQGKIERFHQALFRWLDKQPLGATLAELQEQVDRFDVIYNTERPHQGLPGRVTPQAAWDATPIAEPPWPRPAPLRPVLLDPVGGAPGTPLDIENMRAMRVQSSAAIWVRGVTYQIAREFAGHTVYVATNDDGITFYDQTGERLIEHPWPPSVTKHVGNGRPRGAGTTRPENIRDVIRSTGETSPTGEYSRTVRTDGRVSIRNVVYGIGRDHAGQAVHAVIGTETVAFWDATTGEIIAEHPIPAPGIKTVGYRRYARKLPTFTPADTDEVSPMS